MTIPQIKEFLEDNGLAFLGFTGPVAQAYRRRFPNDPALTDLDQWHVFETEHPDAFVNMYQFWVQKIGVSGRDVSARIHSPLAVTSLRR